MAFPRVAQAGQNEQILFIREDWLEKVGMEPPTTLEEMEAVAEAFVTNDLGAGPARNDGWCDGVARPAELVRRPGTGLRRIWRAALLVHRGKYFHQGWAGRSAFRRYPAGDERCAGVYPRLVREEDSESRLFHEGLPGKPHRDRGQIAWA